MQSLYVLIGGIAAAVLMLALVATNVRAQDAYTAGGLTIGTAGAP